ncbi:hypothetical protein ADK54_19635 [Streptomyces sp. WM6378]|nr:hypothetical protein ADK54_19635 [Streptomyces sp. WM6378]
MVPLPPRNSAPSRRFGLILGVVTAFVLATACSGNSGHAHASADPAPTRPSASTAPPVKPVDVSSFVGHWTGHGNWLQVNGDGSFEIGKRLYVTCDQAAPPCDTVVNGQITDGGHATGRLTGVDGTAATGSVAESNDLGWLKPGPLTMTLNPGTDSIATAGTNYCGPDAPSHVCY